MQLLENLEVESTVVKMVDVKVVLMAFLSANQLESQKESRMVG